MYEFLWVKGLVNSWERMMLECLAYFRHRLFYFQSSASTNSRECILKLWSGTDTIIADYEGVQTLRL